jgi:hypothetical protein
MHWFLVVQLLSGILHTRRTVQKLADAKLIDANTRATISATVFALLFLIAFLLFDHPLIQSFIFVMIGSGLSAGDFFFQRRLQRRIQSEFPGFIDRILLAMKTGYAFRPAVERALTPQNHAWEKWLLAMIETHIFLRPNNHATDHSGAFWWHEYFRELRILQKNAHHAVARLESLRRKLKVMSEFRRKSGHALLQARIQLWVMTVLYLALLAMTMTQFHLYDHRRLILGSLALFTSGQISFWWLARKRKWKV